MHLLARVLVYLWDQKDYQLINFKTYYMAQEKVYLDCSAGGFDDFGYPISKRIIDGKTEQGPWALMTPESFVEYGVGLGVGYGQLYELQKDGKWLLIKGGANRKG